MVQRIFSWLVAYDAWCEGRVRALLTWLEEWFSISQKRAEEGMIALYLALSIVTAKWTFLWIGVDICLWIFVGSIMVWLHRRPAMARGGGRRYADLAALRVVFQATMFFTAGVEILAPLPSMSGICNGVAQIVYIAFFYMTDINSSGKPGQRRKLALAELKKLLNVAWIPKPALEPE
jgi:hypothetical protein